jgi:hypothetical protein
MAAPASDVNKAQLQQRQQRQQEQQEQQEQKKPEKAKKQKKEQKKGEKRPPGRWNGVVVDIKQSRVPAATVGRPKKAVPAQEQHQVRHPAAYSAQQFAAQQQQQQQAFATMGMRPTPAAGYTNGGVHAPPALASNYSHQAQRAAAWPPTLPSNGPAFLPSAPNQPHHYVFPLPMVSAPAPAPAPAHHTHYAQQQQPQQQQARPTSSATASPANGFASTEPSSRPRQPTPQQVAAAKAGINFCWRCIWPHTPEAPCNPATTQADIRLRLDALQSLAKKGVDVDAPKKTLQALLRAGFGGGK